MKIRELIGSLAMIAVLALASKAMAHSDHNHSTVPYKWALSKNLQVKLDQRLDSANPTALIGLNLLEQKKLEHYDINVGNKFNTEARGINFLMERTSAGMKIVDGSRIGKVSYTDQVPIKKARMFSKVSMNSQSHVGHDHAVLPYEWTFGLATQDKIVRRMVQNEGNVFVGLTAFEQSVLEEYDIQPGNTFQTTIQGHKFLIEKTSSGIKVVGHADAPSVAMAPDHSENM
ncbi:MAG: hypothetical protein F3742_07840 [Nitrospinae bacterium]|nr:hypothetical protein [Nitrospinota bacterium]